MAKSDTRRAAILDALTDHVLAQGLAGASLRPLARAAGISDRMLLYYFKDKGEVIAAILGLIAERMQHQMGARTAQRPLPPAALQAQLLDILLADDLWPYMQVWLDVASLSARGDLLYRAIGEQIGRGFLAWGMAQLDSPADRREADAARLLVTIEGMMVLKSIGMDGVCRAAL